MNYRVVPTVALVFVGCQAPSQQGTVSGATGGTGETPFALAFEEIQVEGGLNLATDLEFLPTSDGGMPELLVLTKQGEIVHLRLGADGAERLGTFTVPDVYGRLDCGLISIALDPDFATNRFLYVGQCLSQTDSAIMRLSFTPEDYEAIGGSSVEIFRAGDPLADRPWHNIGAIGFDSTGALWALLGDKHVRENGQDLDDDLGAVIRIIPSRGAEGGHTPAPDNPFIGTAGVDPDVWAYGLRSPWRGALDGRGRLWIGDVGANDFEEINLLTMPGQNAGWATHEGPCAGECDGVTDPIVWWHHDEVTQYMLDDAEVRNTNARVAWVGLEPQVREVDPYGGALAGKMLFGDFCLGYVRALEVDVQGAILSDTHLGHLAHVSGWEQAPDGYLYATTFGSCETVKLDVTDPPPSQLVRAVVAQ